VCEGFDENSSNRNDNIEVLLRAKSGLLDVKMYKCEVVGSEHDNIRIIPIGGVDAIIEVDQCRLLDGGDEGFCFGSRENTSFDGFAQIYIYDSIIQGNWGNGIKAVGSEEYKSIIGITGDVWDYRWNGSGSLDLEGLSDNWWLLGIAEELD
jgi:hypothetical protein